MLGPRSPRKRDIVDIDADVRNSDWLKRSTWDVWTPGHEKLVETREELERAIHPMTVEHFLTLPAAQAMPEPLKAALHSGVRRPVWVVRCGESGEAEEVFRSESIVALNWAEVPSLAGCDSDEQIREMLEMAMPSAAEGTRKEARRQLRGFLFDVEVGDLAVVPWKTKRAIAIAEVSGPYHYQRTPGLAGFGHRRVVRWRGADIPRSALSPRTDSELNQRPAFFAAKKGAAELTAIFHRGAVSARQSLKSLVDRRQFSGQSSPSATRGRDRRGDSGRSQAR